MAHICTQGPFAYKHTVRRCSRPHACTRTHSLSHIPVPGTAEAVLPGTTRRVLGGIHHTYSGPGALGGLTNVGVSPPRSLLSSWCISTLSLLLPLPSFQKGPECSACLSRVLQGCRDHAPIPPTSCQCAIPQERPAMIQGPSSIRGWNPGAPRTPSTPELPQPEPPSPADLAHLERRRPPLAQQEERRHDGVRSRPAHAYHGPTRRLRAQPREDTPTTPGE